MKWKTCWLAPCIFIVTGAFAQPQIKQQRNIGGSADDYLYTVAFTRDGGLIAGGASYSGVSGDKTGKVRGQSDYWIVKLDSNGRTQWDKTIGGSDYDFLSMVEQTQDGGYILGGYSSSNLSAEKTESSRGFYDYWIVKLDSAGYIQWDKTIGGLGQDVLTAIKQTTDGGYIAGGYSFSNISGEKSERSRGNYDYWVVKLNGNGNLQWDKTVGGTYEDDLLSLAQTEDGGYILGGSSESGISGEKTQGSRGFSDYWIVKLDDTGHVQWDKTYGGSNVDGLSDIMETADNGYLLGGYSFSDISGEKRQNSKGANDYWIIKTDSTGKMQWSQAYGGNGFDNFRTFIPTADGGYMLGGTSQSGISGDKTEVVRGATGYDDYWILKLDNRGKIQWDKTIGGDLVDELKKIKEVGKNSYALAGYSGSGISYDKTTDTKGGIDFWLVKLNYIKPDSAITMLPKSMQVTAKAGIGLSVYPNPAKEVLHIKINGTASFVLTNQRGKMILTKTITNSGFINVSKLQPGMYFLVNKNTNVSQKVIVSK